MVSSAGRWGFSAEALGPVCGSRLILSWRLAVLEFSGPSAVQNLIFTRSQRKESLLEPGTCSEDSKT